MGYRDVDIRGYVRVKFENSILFEEMETGKRAYLPREEIAIVEEIEGVTVTLPAKLAAAKGLNNN